MQAGAVTHVILGSLRSGPRSGYEIKQLVDRSTRFFWAASYGQIYPELRRLAAAGLIEPAEEAPVGGRRRVRYRLTDAGRAELERWLREPAAGFEHRDEGLLRLFFADAASPEDRVALVARMRAEREHVLARLREIERTLPPDAGTCTREVLAYGIGMYEWAARWCAELERRLEAEEGDGR